MGPAYERTEELTAIANGLKIISPYMIFGGTNWGWLPADVVYTSYDYGAPFNEARQPTAKVGAMKELGYFVQSVTPIDKVDPEPVVSATNVSPAGATVKAYHDVNPDTGTGFYVVRNDSPATDATFTLPISTPDGSFTIPESGSLELNGIDAKIITADYDFGSQHLVYSTSQIMTHATINGQDMAIFDGGTGQSGETMLHFAPVTLPYSDPLPGVAWYRTTFTLNEPAGADASLGLTINDVATKAYRATIFLNGWNMGQYINNVGPQHTFVLPNGILRTGIGDDGTNTLAIAVITNNPGGGPTGGGLGTVSLTNLGTVAGGVSVTDVDSPGYAAPTASATTITPQVGMQFSGSVGHLTVPADSRGTAFAATVDWGDGTSSAATLAPDGDGYDIRGTHTYSTDASYPVNITVTDSVDQETLATATGRAFAYEFAPGGGTFVVGDQSATGPVLFWGDTWWTSNTLSGGPAPADFKGFAASPSTPACGTNWVTRVGGSSSPPAGPLPDYLGVIVSSSVSQSGVAVSGDTTGIVVVKTDPGYGPLPTEHGTGTVVATAC